VKGLASADGPFHKESAPVADQYSTWTTAQLQEEADRRDPPVDLSGASTNAQRADLLRADDERIAAETPPEDAETADESTEPSDGPTTSLSQPSVGQGPTQDQATEAVGASPEQGRTSNLASSEEEMQERAEFVAASVVSSIAPGRAREEAAAARKRAGASDPEQAMVETALADKLDEVAERYEAQQAAQAERSRIMNRAGGLPQRSASGVLGEPLPDSVKVGTVAVYHTPDGQADTTSLVIGVWPAVPDNEDEPDGASTRWRANLELFPLHGSPSSLEGVPYGTGIGQFQDVAEVEEAEDQELQTVPTADQTPFRPSATAPATAP
jgi:hypothetical protein